MQDLSFTSTQGWAITYVTSILSSSGSSQLRNNNMQLEQYAYGAMGRE